jgi:hypothetical protein
LPVAAVVDRYLTNARIVGRVDDSKRDIARNEVLAEHLEMIGDQPKQDRHAVSIATLESVRDREEI